MAKAIWKGEISFGLVAIPVSLVSTEENHDLKFHLLNSKTKARVRYQRIDESSGKEVPWDDVVKGYEYEKGNYIVVNETKTTDCLVTKIRQESHKNSRCSRRLCLPSKRKHAKEKIK